MGFDHGPAQLKAQRFCSLGPLSIQPLMVDEGDDSFAAERGVEVGLVQLGPQHRLPSDLRHQLGHELIEQLGAHRKGFHLYLLGLLFLCHHSHFHPMPWTMGCVVMPSTLLIVDPTGLAHTNLLAAGKLNGQAVQFPREADLVST